MDVQNHRADIQPDDQVAQHKQRQKELDAERLVGLARTAGVKTEEDFKTWVVSNSGINISSFESNPKPTSKPTPKPTPPKKKARVRKPRANK